MDPMDYGAARFWLAASQYAMTLVVGLYAWWTARTRATQAQINGLRDRLDSLDKRLDHVEIEIRPLPRTVELIREIDGDLKAIRTQLTGLDDRFKPINESLSRINDYLLQERK